MDDGHLLLAALHDRPGDDLAWLAFADWLEESGQAGPAELTRLVRTIRGEHDSLRRAVREQRVRDLLAAGVQPVVPRVTNSVGMTFALIPPGTFRMGSPAGEVGRFADETPLHPVTLTRPYYLGIHPITQAQYEAVTGLTPSSFAASGAERDLVVDQDTSSFPVESLTWNDAVAFCQALSDLPAERAARRTYRLPSEAEWEYACRGGIYTPTPYSFGGQIRPDLARYDFLSSEDRTRFTGEAYRPCPAPVGTFRPNAFGLYDMHGNVWEYCQDWFDRDYYQNSPPTDPPGPESGDTHTLRGGSWYSQGAVCRAACRNPIANMNTSGARVLLSAGGAS